MRIRGFGGLDLEVGFLQTGVVRGRRGILGSLVRVRVYMGILCMEVGGALFMEPEVTHSLKTNLEYRIRGSVFGA